MILFSKLPSVCGGTLLQLPADTPLSYLLFDSRKLVVSPGATFFALKGQQQDGHRYLQQAYQGGIRCFVLEQAPREPMPEASILQVPDSLAALQQLAGWHRRQFSLPLLAITGSNGKTIVKEWLSSLLPASEQVVRSPKSYNSQIGVALSVWQLHEQHSIGIFEAGISQLGEMRALQQVLAPTLGLFTNIGPAHSRGFASLEEKVAEKALLFTDAHTIIYCRDHAPIHAHLQQQYAHKTLIGWSQLETEGPWRAGVVRRQRDSLLQLHTPAGEHSYRLPFRDSASIENALHCLFFLHSQGYAHSELQKQLSQLALPAMRLELKQGVNGSYLLDDAYNNDLAGLQVALEFLQQQKHLRKKTVILSDLLQSGLAEGELYTRVAELLQMHQVGRLIGVGPAISRAAPLFASIGQTAYYDSTEALLQEHPERQISRELVLIKGARPFGFERLVSRLQQKVHGTVLEIDLDALAHNLNFYRSRLKPGTKTMVMVKAFAYGSGSHEVAHLLQYQHVDYLAVAYPDEGISLRQAGITLPIMVMNAAEETFASLLEWELEPELYSLSQLKAFLHYLKTHRKQARVHLKMDTGMHRLGFSRADLPELMELLRASLRLARPPIEVASLFSHLAGADSAEFNDFSQLQAQRLRDYYEQLAEALSYRPLLHLLNSAGILRFPEYQFDMVRLGIGLYGAEVNGMEQRSLHPISTLKTTVSQVKQIPEGETVGYSRSQAARQNMQLATIAIGYADGFDRRFSNGVGKVLIGGALAPVVGRVCMDMTMVDVSGLDVQEGDEVIVFGPERPITQLAGEIGTIPYEILTSVSERVKRVFYSA
ncbi:bifunctional UDP-N-acetylmuramoyl-tripeptide:D-alanyl-D-alanine ligase/alanine racemase [Cesiribacter andamanensis]|uniref:Alanine racemase n=1 Tax=Cesiribacter andamanensis AMV16 TaxID=1279009 RepID=M7NK38_9BACT|nr:bifunctional UDP-N-acetylmuramoyl-tripeptide:D-alanyl-D-alanine ligase/alanine racemase [Cesiribacter andamanensis]EMR02145.1 Alanine racemase [Cesiribacter andamanensis AMV16]